MAIIVRCSSCRQQFQVRDGLAEKAIVCRECGAEFQARAASAGDRAGNDPPDADVGAPVIDDGRLLLLGVEKQDMALPVIEIPQQ